MSIKEEVHALIDRLTEEEMAQVRAYLLVLLEERPVLTEAEAAIAAALVTSLTEEERAAIAALRHAFAQ